MKKIGILTFHCADNYGAVLQCLGQQEFLISQGYDVKIINYHPQYLLDKHSILVNPIVRFKEYKNLNQGINSTIKKTTKSILENVYFPKRVTRKMNFSKYRKKYLKQTKQVNNLIEVNELVKDYDVLICGSDQIWNNQMSNEEFDKVFFLKFDSGNFRKVSYAASAGSIINEYDKNKFIELINEFDNISVREEKLLNQVNNWTNKNAELVLDPSMLLTGEQWSNYIDEKKVNGKYILVYCLEKNEKMFDLITEIYKRLNIKIIEIDMRRRLNIEGKVLSTINPGEFLSLIKNSEFVVTNSFHGTVFSILYKKNFVSIPHLKLGERMRTLLTILNLEDKLITDKSMIENAFTKIDYEEVDKKLQILRSKSIDYLIGAIEGE